MSVNIKILPVPLLPAALIHSTASTSVSTSMIASAITLLPGNTTTHVQVMVGLALDASVSDTITINGELSGIQVGTLPFQQFTSGDISLTDTIWQNHSDLGYHTIITIELPPEAIRYAPIGVVTTLTLVGNCNGATVQFIAVPDGNGGLTHNRLLAGIPSTSLAGYPTITTDNITSGAVVLMQKELSLTIPNYVQQSLNETLVSISFFIECPICSTNYKNLPNYPYPSYSDLLNEKSHDMYTLNYTYSQPTGTAQSTSTTCTPLSIEGSKVGQYQMITIYFNVPIPLPTQGTILNFNTTPPSVPILPGYKQISGLVQIAPSSTKTRPVGYCTADTPDYYDWGLGAYLGADFATGNCVTQRSSSTDCRKWSMCHSNTCSIVGSEYACFSEFPLTTIMNPMSPDHGISAGPKGVTLPTPYPVIGSPDKVSALRSTIPSHLLARSDLAAASSGICQTGPTYYIPPNTQLGLVTDGTLNTGISPIQDVYNYATGFRNISCTVDVDGIDTPSWYPCTVPGGSFTTCAGGCSETAAVCYPGTTPFNTNINNRSDPTTGNCSYICLPSDPVCVDGFVSVDGICRRVPPIKEAEGLTSYELCATVDNGCTTNNTSISDYLLLGNGWTQDSLSCTLRTSNSTYECDPFNYNRYTIDNSIGSHLAPSGTPVPYGYYYWQYVAAQPPSFDVFDMYAGQVKCIDAAGCYDAPASYSLSWEGGGWYVY